MSGSIPLPEVVTRFAGGFLTPSAASALMAANTAAASALEVGPRLVGPVAIGSSASGRPWNQPAPFQVWPTRVEPLTVSDPLASAGNHHWERPVVTSG